MARMPQLRFQLYTFAGSWPWCYGLAYVGLKLGERWDSDPRLRAIMHQADAVIVVALVAGLAWYIWRHWRSRRADRPSFGHPSPGLIGSREREATRARAVRSRRVDTRSARSRATVCARMANIVGWGCEAVRGDPGESGVNVRFQDACRAARYLLGSGA